MEISSNFSKVFAGFEFLLALGNLFNSEVPFFLKKIPFNAKKLILYLSDQNEAQLTRVATRKGFFQR